MSDMCDRTPPKWLITLGSHLYNPLRWLICCDYIWIVFHRCYRRKMQLGRCFSLLYFVKKMCVHYVVAHTTQCSALCCVRLFKCKTRVNLLFMLEQIMSYTVLQTIKMPTKLKNILYMQQKKVYVWTRVYIVDEIIILQKHNPYVSDTLTLQKCQPR